MVLYTTIYLFIYFCDEIYVNLYKKKEYYKFKIYKKNVVRNIIRGLDS